MASTDWGGTLKIWDIERQRVIADIKHLHHGLITHVSWTREGGLVTAGLDGSIHILDDNFSITHSWELGEQIRYVLVRQEFMYAALANGDIWSILLTNGVERRTSLGATFTAFAASPSGTHIAAGSDDGEIFIMDTEHRIIARRLERDVIGCAAFLNEETLLFCAPNGHLLRLLVDHRN